MGFLKQKTHSKEGNSYLVLYCYKKASWTWPSTGSSKLRMLTET